MSDQTGTTFEAGRNLEAGVPVGRSPLQPHDADRVNADDDNDAQYWTSRFGCTRTQLKEAVGKVGESVESVEKELLKAN